VAKIPRLENVSKLIADQANSFDEETPIGARILKLTIDFDALRSTGKSDDQAIGVLLGRRSEYDPVLVEELRAQVGSSYVVRGVKLDALREGMVLEENACGESGEILVRSGRQLTAVLLERLRNHAGHRGIREPLHVRVSCDANEPGRNVESVKA
jgi:hypothetical protein